MVGRGPVESPSLRLSWRSRPQDRPKRARSPAGSSAPWWSPAVMAGIAGDYIIDTGAAQSALHETSGPGRGHRRDRPHRRGAAWPGKAVKAAPAEGASTWTSAPGTRRRRWPGVIGADALRGLRAGPDLRALPPSGLRAAGRGASVRAAARCVWAGTWGGPRWKPRCRMTPTGSPAASWSPPAPTRPSAWPTTWPRRRARPRPRSSTPTASGWPALPQVDFAGATGRDVATGLMKPEGEVVGVLGGRTGPLPPAVRLSGRPADRGPVPLGPGCEELGEVGQEIHHPV